MTDFVDLPIIFIAFLATLVLTIQARKFLLARALLDRPNERSSHTVPTPRGGGWAVIAVLISGMILGALLGHDFVTLPWIIAGTLLLALISWQDDRKGVNTGLRLLLHVVAAGIGSLALGKAVLFSGVLPFWLDRTLMIIGWAWFMNLYNFMDGIDGVTCTETIALATGACIVMIAANIIDPFTDTLTLLLTGACLGFLALNWYPAKIFMGDVGSVPLGFLTGYLLITIASKGYLIPALILPLYYIADSGITITQRALRGEKIWQPHRQHFYQKAALAAGRHDIVVFWIAIADIALIIAALFAVAAPWIGLTCGIAIVAILLGKMHRSG